MLHRRNTAALAFPIRRRPRPPHGPAEAGITPSRSDPSVCATARLQATETGNGRIRAYPAVPSDYRSDTVDLSLITAHLRAPASGYAALRLPSAGAASLG
jgi:hypothetical protein